jgi:hypothetical protein
MAEGFGGNLEGTVPSRIMVRQVGTLEWEIYFTRGPEY